MLPPVYTGDYRHHTRPLSPVWLRRDFDDLPLVVTPRHPRRLRIPVWPGFRLALSLERISPVGGCNV